MKKKLLCKTKVCTKDFPAKQNKKNKRKEEKNTSFTIRYQKNKEERFEDIFPFNDETILNLKNKSLIMSGRAVGAEKKLLFSENLDC